MIQFNNLDLNRVIVVHHSLEVRYNKRTGMVQSHVKRTLFFSSRQWSLQCLPLTLVFACGIQYLHGQSLTCISVCHM